MNNVDIGDFFIPLEDVEQWTSEVVAIGEKQIVIRINWPDGESESLPYIDKELYHVKNGGIEFSNEGFSVGDMVICKDAIRENTYEVFYFLEDPPKDDYYQDALDSGCKPGAIITSKISPDPEGKVSAIINDFVFPVDSVQNLSHLPLALELKEKSQAVEQSVVSGQIVMKEIDTKKKTPEETAKNIADIINQGIEKDEKKKSKNSGSDWQKEDFWNDDDLPI